jgi:hypothetical protein
MKTKLLATVALAGAAAAVFAVTAWAMAGRAPAHAPKPHLQHMAFSIVSVGPGAAGDEVRPVGNFAIAPGIPVRVTVKNFTHQLHTFTVPGLRLSAAIRPAHGKAPTTTTFTFVSYQGGKLAWHCVVCVGQHHRHVMAGTVYAIIDPSVVP